MSPRPRISAFLPPRRVGFSGRNLLNFFDYSSYDPEVSNFGTDAISSNVEVTPFPSAKSLFFTLGASF
ncbi:MAG: hypothetical protein IPK76_10890 [Lewinellaceae bacterium]|nr:hypothetical protein [Lewinellaceae bacterium]